MRKELYFCCALSAIVAAAAQPQDALTLSAAIAEAAHNPSLLAAAARIDVAQGFRTQAALAPNPRLFLQVENLRPPINAPFSYGSDADTFAYVSQVIERGGKRERRTELAEAGIERAKLEQQMLAFQIAARVAVAYWSAAGAAHVQQLLEEDLANFERIVQYHRDRVREGAMAEVDLLRIQLERERILTSAQTAAREAERAQLLLLRDIGRTRFEAVKLTEPIEAGPPPGPVAWDRVLELRPEMRLARQAVEQARANLRLQQATAAPDADVLAGYKRTAGFNTVLAGVQVNLPFRNRNQGSIAAAEADIRAASASVTATEAFIQAELASATRDYDLRRRQITETFGTMRERAAENARIAQAAYREGGTDLLRLLDAERTRLETDILYYRTLAELQQSAVTLQITRGILP